MQKIDDVIKELNLPISLITHKKELLESNYNEMTIISYLYRLAKERDQRFIQSIGEKGLFDIENECKLINQASEDVPDANEL